MVPVAVPVVTRNGRMSGCVCSVRCTAWHPLGHGCSSEGRVLRAYDITAVYVGMAYAYM